MKRFARASRAGGGDTVRLRQLTDVSRALTNAESLEEVLQLTVERAAQLLGATRAVLVLSDGDGGVDVKAACGVDVNVLAPLRGSLDEQLILELRQLCGWPDTDAVVGVPLVLEGRVIGLLGVVRRGMPTCSTDEEWLLSALADQAVIAIEHARLDGELREDLQRLSAIERTVAAKDNALAMLGHDVRTPLSAVMGYLQLLELEMFGPLTPRQREVLGHMRTGVSHLQALVENVHEMTRARAGALSIESRSVTAAHVVEEAAFILRPASEARGVRIRIEHEYGLAVRACPDRLRQILINLIDNAVRHARAGGAVVIRQSADETSGVIAVIDDGPGVHPDHRAEIFEAFCRLGDEADSTTRHAGLGLTSALALARAMGGSIDVGGDYGHGAVFAVRLPLA